MNTLGDLQNRIKKNIQRLRGWAKSHGYEAFRVYDRDIPEHPYTIDIYGEHAVAWSHFHADEAGPEESLLKQAIAKALGISEALCILKARHKMPGKNQYQRLDQSQNFITVKEGPLAFRVNLIDYLDTGLFLDTRILRQKILPHAVKAERFLNLFAYTGTMSVAAAQRGFCTVTIDMSATYLAWAEENFRLNGLSPTDHEFIQADVLQFLEGEAVKLGAFDWIYLDPPTFSNSKRMTQSFDVKRDQVALIKTTMRLLKPQGTLIFVTNHQKFKLSETLLNDYEVKEITEQTVPRDCDRRRPHRSYQIRIRR